MNKKYIYSHRYFTFRYRQKVCCKPFQRLIIQILQAVTLAEVLKLILKILMAVLDNYPRSTLTTWIPGIPGIKNYQ